MIRTFIKATATISLAVLVSACTVGPDYQPPENKLPDSWLESSEQPQGSQSTWWKDFNDPILNDLITRAITGNPDLKVAIDRVIEVRAQHESAEGKLWPEISGQFGASKGNPGAATTDSELTTIETAFDAAWEIDLFGGNHRRVEAEKALIGSREAALRSARLTLTAEVAREYIELRKNQNQLQLAQETAKTQEHLHSIAVDRYKHEMASALDAAQAETLWQATLAHVPELERQIKAGSYRLSVLLGEEPGSVAGLLDKSIPIPKLHTFSVVDAPADIIRRRPDVAEAERNLASATALHGVAISALYPKLSISALFGIQNGKLPVFLYDQTSTIWNTGANIAMPILEFGTLEGQIDAADARQQQALHTYQMTVLRALGDVETSLSNLNNEGKKLHQLNVATISAKHAIAIARDRYGSGLNDFTTVLQAEQQRFAIQNDALAAEASLSEAAVALHKALANDQGIENTEN